MTASKDDRADPRNQLHAEAEPFTGLPAGWEGSVYLLVFTREAFVLRDVNLHMTDSFVVGWKR